MGADIAQTNGDFRLCGPSTTSASLPPSGDKQTLRGLGRFMSRRRTQPTETNFFGYNQSEARRPDKQVRHPTLGRDPGTSLREIVGGSG